MSDSVRPHTRQPTRLPCPWDSPGKNTGVGCHFLLQCMKDKSESEVTQLSLTLSDTMDCSLPGSSIHGISRQEYWSGVPLPSPHVPSGSPKISPSGLQSQTLSRLSLQCGTPVLVNLMWSQTSHSLGRALAMAIIPPSVGHPPKAPTLLPISFFLYVFSCQWSFLVDSIIFHRWLFYK